MRTLADELEGALVNSEGRDFQIDAEFVRELIAALRANEEPSSSATTPSQGRTE